MKVQKKIDVSMSGCYLPRPVKVVASDTAIQLVLRYVDLEIPSNAKATLFVMKPSKNFVYQTDDITISGNVVTINVKNQAIIEKGRAYFTVTITSGEDSISTFENYFDVDRNYKESNAEESRSMISEFEKTLDELRAGSIQIEEIEGGHRVTLKDVNGPHVFNVMDGEDGKNGDDGYSPTVDVSKSGKETTIKITDKNGEHTSTIKDGTDGKDGTSVTHSWDGTVLTVKTASGESAVDLQGPKGEAFTYDDFTEEQLEALKGKDGYTPQKDVDYSDGENGVGIESIVKTATEGLVDTYTITLTNGKKETFTVKNGSDGQDGTMTFEDLTEEQKATLKGADGKSAYEYAKDGGFEGTAEEFARKLAEENGVTDYNELTNTPSIPASVVQIYNEFAIGASEENVSDSTEWTTRTSPLSQRQRACAFGGGYYVVCGTAGDFAYSKDGVSWVKITAFTSDVITSICYGKGKFLAVDSGGKLWLANSPTDVWEDAGITFELIIESVCYANNRFIAVCDGGYALLSDNGKDWQTVKTCTDNNLYGVCAGDGMFVAVGASGTVVASVDGNIWVDRTNTAVTGDLRCVGYGNGMFVAGGAGGVIECSSDAVTWTIGESNTALAINYIRAIVYAYGKFYAVMYASNGTGEIWVSEDGVTWTVQYSASGRVWCAVACDAMILASGDSGTIYAFDFGVEWMNEKPDIAENEWLWQRAVVILSDGGRIVSEAYMVNGNIDTEIHTSVTMALQEAKDSGDFKGDEGEDGYTPVRGTDYWTTADVSAMETYCKNYIDTELLGGAS